MTRHASGRRREDAGEPLRTHRLSLIFLVGRTLQEPDDVSTWKESCVFNILTSLGGLISRGGLSIYLVLFMMADEEDVEPQFVVTSIVDVDNDVDNDVSVAF